MQVGAPTIAIALNAPGGVVQDRAFFTGNPMTAQMPFGNGAPSEPMIKKVMAGVKPVLADENEQVRNQATLLWGALAGHQAQAIFQQQQQAGGTAANSGPVAAPDVTSMASTMEPLEAALKDKAADVRASAATSLGNLTTFATPGTVPALISATSDSDANVRRAAIWALARFGPAAKSATATLTKLLKDSDAQARAAAASALGAIIADVDATPSGAGQMGIPAPNPFFPGVRVGQ
jgi:HEAT repeat protein